MLLILILFGGLWAQIYVDIVGSKLSISGNGEISQNDVQSKGDYTIITDINIEDGPIGIGDKAFYKMVSLKTIKFSKSIQSISSNRVFHKNNALESLIVDVESKYLYADGKSLYNYNKTIFYKTIRRPVNLIIDPNTEVMMNFSLGSVIECQEVTIPSKVTYLGEYLFVESSIAEIKFEKSSLVTCLPRFMCYYTISSKIHIPSSVTIISSYSFKSCTCNEIIFDDIETSSCTTLMPFAFDNILGNTVVIELPQKITLIPDNCFKNSLIKTINIPRDCISISNEAFIGCTNLVSVTVDEGNKAFKIIGSTLYNYNETQIVFVSPNIDTLSISANLEQISSSLVQMLEKVTVIDVDKDNKVFSGEDGCLYNKDKSILIGVCGGVKQLNISENTEKISDSACDSVSITSITFKGDKVNTIGANSFRGCSKLTHVELTPNITTISTSAFQSSGLTSIDLLNVVRLGASCFQDTPLTNVIFGRSFSSPGRHAFKECNSLSNITFDPEIKISCLSEGMFYKSGVIGTKIQIPKSVVCINESAFYDSNYLISFENGSKLTIISDNAFEKCRLNGELELPSTLTYIGIGSFSGCTELTELKFDGECQLQTIGNLAFKGCSSLKSFYVPRTLQRFDQSVFSNCFGLSSVKGKVENTNLSVINNIIYSNNLAELIICPPGLSTASVQSEVSLIASNAFYNCAILTRVIFLSPSNVRTLSDNVFSGCVKLSSIILPQSIENLSSGCFENCVELTSVTFEGNGNEGSHLKMLMDSVFKGCEKLISVTFHSPSGFVSIGNSAFEGCLSLASIALPSSVESIGSDCFKQSGLQSIEFNSLKTVGEGAFAECKQLRNASLNSLKSIPSKLFDGCSQFDSFLFSGQSQTGFRSFAGCNFNRLVIPMGVTSIGESGFAENKNLETVNLSSSVAKIGESCFAECPKILLIVYCGSSGIGENNCGLNGSEVILYVSQEFPHGSFCRSAVRKQLDSACLFLPPTPTHSSLFTALTGTDHCFAFVLGANSMDDS